MNTVLLLKAILLGLAGFILMLYGAKQDEKGRKP